MAAVACGPDAASPAVAPRHEACTQVEADVRVRLVLHTEDGSRSPNTVTLLSLPRAGLTLAALRRAAGVAPVGGAALWYRLPSWGCELACSLATDGDVALMVDEFDDMVARGGNVAAGGGSGGGATAGPRRLHVYAGPAPASAAAALAPATPPSAAPSGGRAAAAAAAAAAASAAAAAAALQPSSPQPSPRSVLLQWRTTAACARRRGAAASRSPPPPAARAPRGRAWAAADTAQPCAAADPAASSSMRLLAAAVVANVLGGDGDGDGDGYGGGGGGDCAAWPPHPPPPPPPAPSPPPFFPPHCPAISADDMVLGPLLGGGTYAVVHAGWWRGAAVAVKILRQPPAGGCPAAARRAWAAFGCEAALLSRLQHPNVLALFGCVAPAAPGVPPAVVLELMPHGSLRTALRARYRPAAGAGAAAGLAAAAPAPPGARLCARLALGAARALLHLHAQACPVVHHDLKADNLLVDWRDPAAPVCKLADLGLARPLAAATPGAHSGDPAAAAAAAASPSSAFAAAPSCHPPPAAPPISRASASGRGTLWWMAPELLPGAPGGSLPLTTAVDVYSFGVVCWEIATGGADPWPPGAPADAVVAAVRAGVRPALPPGLCPAWGRLIAACWRDAPHDRPTALQLVAALDAMAWEGPA